MNTEIKTRNKALLAMWKQRKPKKLQVKRINQMNNYSTPEHQEFIHKYGQLGKGLLEHHDGNLAAAQSAIDDHYCGIYRTDHLFGWSRPLYVACVKNSPLKQYYSFHSEKYVNDLMSEHYCIDVGDTTHYFREQTAHTPQDHKDITNLCTALQAISVAIHYRQNNEHGSCRYELEEALNIITPIFHSLYDDDCCEDEDEANIKEQSNDE